MNYPGDIAPAKISFPSKSQIAKGLDTSISTVENGLSVLESYKLIYIRRDMFVENKKKKVCLFLQEMYMLLIQWN